jgi:hypothetical protein
MNRSACFLERRPHRVIRLEVADHGLETRWIQTFDHSPQDLLPSCHIEVG